MKTENWFLLSILLVVAATLSECTVQKRTYRNGYYVSWKKKAVDPSHPNKVDETIKVIRLKDKIQTTAITKRDVDSKSLFAATDQDLATKRKTLMLHALPVLADTCGDLLTLRDGSEIIAKIIEVNPNSLKYKPCDNLTGPIKVTSVEKVFMIRYVNGSKEVFDQKIYTPIQAENKPTVVSRAYTGQELKTSGWAVAGFIVSLFSWLFVPAIVAIFLGAKANSQIDKHPDQFKGKGLATAAIVIGFIFLLIFIMVLAV